MAFKSDKQRKGFFASRGNRNTGHIAVDKVMKRQLQKTRSKEQCDKLLKDKIRKNIKEGKPRKQAVAIAFSQVRKKGCKFPRNSKMTKKQKKEVKSFSTGHRKEFNRLIRTGITLFAALTIIRALRARQP